MATTFTAFIDGGARGNPGPAGWGAVIQSSDGETIAELCGGIPHATNNVAEYAALVAGLGMPLLAHAAANLSITGDIIPAGFHHELFNYPGSAFDDSSLTGTIKYDSVGDAVTYAWAALVAGTNRPVAFGGKLRKVDEETGRATAIAADDTGYKLQHFAAMKLLLDAEQPDYLS